MILVVDIDWIGYNIYTLHTHDTYIYIYYIRCVSGWMDGWMDGLLKDRQVGRETETKTETETETDR